MSSTPTQPSPQSNQTLPSSQRPKSPLPLLLLLLLLLLLHPPSPPPPARTLQANSSIAAPPLCVHPFQKTRPASTFLSPTLHPLSAIHTSTLTSRDQRVALALLAPSFACNVAALLLPFIVLRQGVGSETFSLFHSIAMLWDEGLYALAILVVGFSVIFPFAKLATVAWIVYRPAVSDSQRLWLRRVERLGKWSMLDAFLVTIVLSLASRQFLVGAKSQPGLSLFILAIILSMSASTWIASRLPAHAPPGPAQTNSKYSASLLALSGIALLAALLIPFLRIDDWLLANRDYSILSLVPALWRQGSWLASALVLAFLVLAPLAAWAAQLTAWLRRRSDPAKAEAARLKADHLQRWSMLDVFALALAVFTLESDQMMRTEIRWGALFLAATVALQSIASLRASRTL